MDVVGVRIVGETDNNHSYFGGIAPEVETVTLAHNALEFNIKLSFRFSILFIIIFVFHASA